MVNILSISIMVIITFNNKFSRIVQQHLKLEGCCSPARIQKWGGEIEICVFYVICKCLGDRFPAAANCDYLKTLEVYLPSCWSSENLSSSSSSSLFPWYLVERSLAWPFTCKFKGLLSEIRKRNKKN